MGVGYPEDQFIKDMMRQNGWTREQAKAAANEINDEVAKREADRAAELERRALVQDQILAELKLANEKSDALARQIKLLRMGL